jgi:purine-binding chemotaxis protein CheW
MDALGTAPDVDDERTDSFVIFQLGAESYAIEVARVREVLDAGNLTSVPGAAAALRGLYNLRGQVVPVWSLRVPFQLTDDVALGRAPSVLMVETGESANTGLAGLLVDRVSDVLEFLPEQVQQPPSFGLAGGSGFVRGLIQHQDRFLLVLDVNRVLATLTQTTSATRESQLARPDLV